MTARAAVVLQRFVRGENIGFPETAWVNARLTLSV